MSSLCTDMNYSLYGAIRSGDIDHLKRVTAPNDGGDYLLLRMCSPLNNTSLHVAVQFSCPVQFIEEICKRCPSSFLVQQNMEGDTPLHIAARLGSSDTVAFMISSAYQMIHQVDNLERGGEKLVESGIVLENSYTSSSSSSTTVLQQLVRMANNENDTALHEAVRNGRYEVAELLIEADPVFEYFSNNAEESPLYLAVKNNSTDIIDEMLKKCQSSAHGAPGGRTVLHAAALDKDISSNIVEVLLKKKCHILKDVDKDGRTALHYAAYSGKHRMVKQLLEVDPSVGYMVDKDGMTFLHHIAGGTINTVKRRWFIIDEMIQLCPNCWELHDIKGQNFLHVAAENGNLRLIEYVAEIGSIMENLINRRDKYGNTPLQLARKSCSIYEFDRILKDRVNLSAIRDDMLTAYDIAQNTQKKLNEDDKPDKASMPGAEDRKDRELIENVSQTHMVVATLIATVAFAAGFTLPGGYNSDGPHKGMATLAEKTAFMVFVISNSLALLLSTFSVFVHFWVKIVSIHQDDEDKIERLVMTTLRCTFFAIISMVMAFVTGTYVVLSHSPGLAIPLCILDCSFFPFSFFLLRKIVKWMGIHEIHLLF